MYFSIIVPIYNVESFLIECLNSILSQTFKDYELILVDDGSKDSCPRICDEYKEKNKNILVIHKENGGLSDARNRGLKESSGKYVVFVDSDDMICSTALEEMHSCLLSNNEPEILISRMTNSVDMSELNENTTLFSAPSKKEKKDVFDYLFVKNDFSPASVQYIVKNDFIRINYFEFEYGFIHEDFVWTPSLLLRAETFCYFNNNWYIRRINNANSITKSNSFKGVRDLIVLATNYYSLFKREETEYSELVIAWMANAAMSYFNLYCFFNREQKKEFVKLIKQNMNFFGEAKGFKRRVFMLLCRLFGFRIPLFLQSFVFRRR